MVGFVLGTIYASFLEWWVHKYLFHVRGKKKDSLFAYHLRDHHVVAKRNNFTDIRVSLIEAGGLLFLAIIHLPIFYIAPMFYFATVTYAIAFFVLHNYAHRNPKWAKSHQSWHWKHHMKNPNSNWNVVLPIADWIMKTNK
jgi:hypothetical protein